MNFLKQAILILSLLFFSSIALATPETYRIDPNHSYVLFHISHFDFSQQTGKWYVNGTLTLDKDKPENDKVDVIIKIGDLVTGNGELDKHLKEQLFFNEPQYPTATFVSSKVVKTGANTADIYGTLTVRGMTKQIVLKAKLNKADVSPITKKMTAGFSATTQLRRSDFGMSALPGLGDQVDIEIQVEAIKG